jgi:glycosyltransferase involved in cell wall biosynthesis
MKKKKFPKVTIIIANYNNAIYLRDCINSVLKQNYKNKEIIVVDDKSKDNSIDVLNNFKDKIIVLKNKKKKQSGFFNQMNVYKLGIKNSSGELIFFLDSDDLFKNGKIKKIVKIFLQNPNKKFFFDLPIILKGKKKKKFKFKKKIFQTYWPFIPPTSCMTIQRKYLDKIFKHIYFNKYDKIWMDFRIGIFVKYIFKDFNIIRENLTIYRLTCNNISSKFNHLSLNWWKRRFQAHQYIIYFFKKNNIPFRKNLDFFITWIINSFFK